jgi:hypothetical protein
MHAVDIKRGKLGEQYWARIVAMRFVRMFREMKIECLEVKILCSYLDQRLLWEVIGLEVVSKKDVSRECGTTIRE